MKKHKNCALICTSKGWRGEIQNREQYEGIRDGSLVFGKGDKELESIVIPAEIFMELLNMDREQNGIVPKSNSSKKDHINEREAAQILTAALSVISMGKYT